MVKGHAPIICPSIDIHVEDHATSFFFAQYGVNSSVPNSLPRLFSQWQFCGILAPALESVGAAGLARVKDSQQLHVIAKRKYSTALCIIKAALEDRTKAAEYETLAGIQLLGLYEVSPSLPCSKGIYACRKALYLLCTVPCSTHMSNKLRR